MVMRLWRERILTAREVHRVTSPEDYEQAALRYVRVFVPDAVLVPYEGEQPHAYVNWGRWVCDCRLCANSPSVEPTWQLAICFECAVTYQPLLPENWREVEQILLARPDLRLRNYDVGETIDDLRRQNAVIHGLHTPPHLDNR